MSEGKNGTLQSHSQFECFVFHFFKNIVDSKPVAAYEGCFPYIDV